MAEQTMEPAMALALAASFGSVARWREELAELGAMHRGGSGQLQLIFQPREGRLLNWWATDPASAPEGGVTLLALAADVDAPGADIDWPGVYARYQAAVHAASEPWAASHDDVGAALLLDVRRAGVFDNADSMIPGARWCDPAQVAAWAGGLPDDRAVLVYCVYGHEVGRVTALRLRAAGLDARFLQGGIDGWKAAGRELVAKSAGRVP